MTTRCLTLPILILAARTASAQSPIAPRVELGGTFSAILPVVAADGPMFLIGGGPRLGVNLTSTIGPQGSFEMLGPFGDRDGSTAYTGATPGSPYRTSRAAEICLSRSRARSATSPRNTLYRYFVIHHVVLDVPHRVPLWWYSPTTAPSRPELEAQSLPPERRWA